MPVTLDAEVERVVHTASQLLAATMRMDDWLRETDYYDAMPEHLRQRYDDAYKRAAKAFGQLKAAQYRKP